MPRIQWVNGVSGYGKTTWTIEHFSTDKNFITTNTIESANELGEKLSVSIGNLVNSKIRSMTSMLVNKLENSETC